MRRERWKVPKLRKHQHRALPVRHLAHRRRPARCSQPQRNCNMLDARTRCLVDRSTTPQA